MPAFIQKLLRSRKAADTATNARKTSVHQAPEPSLEERGDKRADQREEQLRILQGPASQRDLADLAIEGVTAEIRQGAASGLTDAAMLQEVQKRAKGKDKGVYQTTKLALQKHREERERLESINQTITALISHASDQARSDDTKLYRARLDALLKQWSEVESHASAEQTQAFLEAVHRCRERVAAIQSAAADEQRQRDQQTQREETLALLADTLGELRNADSPTLPSLASLDALQKTQENRWLEATRDTQVTRQEQKAYETSMQTLRAYLGAVRRISQERESIGKLAEAAQNGNATEDHRARANTLLADINWPDGYPEPPQLEPLRQLLGMRPPAAGKPADPGRQQDCRNRLETTLTELEHTLENKLLKESKQLFKNAQQQLKELDQRNARPFQARIQLLHGQLRELNDWQGFATKPKQIALCEQMEYLAEQPMDPEAKAERIKELQTEWRELGGSSDRTLWSRFKAASDSAFEPCKAYFSAKSGLKQANLEKRVAICEQLETYLDNADWEAIDWKAAERIHQTARQEWKEAWPVEFRDNRPIQKRFDDLLKRLEAPLDEERRKNERLKQDIVQRAEALVDHEPLAEAMNQAKALQAQWKATGITRHREDRKLWQAFRKACDRIFARRDAERSEQREASLAADEAARASLDQALGISPDSDEPSISAALSALQAIDASALSRSVRDQLREQLERLRKLQSRRKVQEKVAAWQGLVDATANGDAIAGTIPDHWQALARETDLKDPADLVIKAEILGGVASPDHDQQRRMEIQVQRLADGIGSADHTADPFADAEALVATWCLAGVGANASPEQAERLSAALAGLDRAN